LKRSSGKANKKFSEHKKIEKANVFSKESGSVFELKNGRTGRVARMDVVSGKGGKD